MGGFKRLATGFMVQAIARSSRQWQSVSSNHCWRAKLSSGKKAFACKQSVNISPAVVVNGQTYTADDWYNIPTNVLACTSRKLHLQKDHPVSIARQIIESSFPPPTFKYYNDLHPVVSTHENFDSLGFPHDHPGRGRSDTYYINRETLLRTHTSAHEAQLFGASESDGYLISADVYRRDEVDRSHYPAFHQMEGARVWDRGKVPGGDVVAAIYRDMAALPLHDLIVEDPNPAMHPERNPRQAEHHTAAEAEAITLHLKRSLELMVVQVFSRAEAAAAVADPNYVHKPLRVRWVEAYFPFTSPSWELEVYYDGNWLEVLGSGVCKQEILVNAGVPSQVGWAFGIGLDRIAMLLFKIPDIRLFWSTDKRFLGQFSGVSNNLALLKPFVPYSKHPACYKDVSFWLRLSHDFHDNDAMEIIRNVAGDVVEDVKLVDDFTHPVTLRRSKCLRVNYRSLEGTLTNEKTNLIHEEVTKAMTEKLGVEIR